MSDLAKLTADELLAIKCDYDFWPELRRRLERLEQCEADSARLDWLDAQRDNGFPDILVGGPWKWVSDEHPSVGQWKIYPADGREKATAYESLRAAIDAARAALEE